MRSAIYLAATVLGFASAPALAADFGAAEPLPTPPAVAAEPTNDWTGFYLGALLGYTFGTADTDAAGDVDADGVDGGAYAGANWQYNNFVLGIEGDVLASGVEGEDGGLEVEQGFNGSLRARAGIALDRFMLYGTAGGAATELELGGGADSDEATLFGWTAGAGAEALVTENITARVEYRYSDYENETFTLGGGDNDSDFTTHNVRAGVGFKF